MLGSLSRGVRIRNKIYSLVARFRNLFFVYISFRNDVKRAFENKFRFLHAVSDINDGDGVSYGDPRSKRNDVTKRSIKRRVGLKFSRISLTGVPHLILLNHDMEPIPEKPQEPTSP